MSLTSAYYNTPINPNIVIYYNCRKDKYFIILYLELKNINNIKKIDKGYIFNESGKKTLREDSSLKCSINFKKINLN